MSFVLAQVVFSDATAVDASPVAIVAGFVSPHSQHS